mmetsp:Transcript_9395/g.15065  ORF Transcript_9395/g.15065 Transcript_9395/m.15065 type:complete len:114 (-) Transcript_9395:148-489(-)
MWTFHSVRPRLYTEALKRLSWSQEESIIPSLVSLENKNLEKKTGYITVRSFCDYGEETIKVPVFCRVIKAEASKGNKGILGIPKHAVKLIQKTGKLSNSTNLAFNTVESRAWN